MKLQGTFFKEHKAGLVSTVLVFAIGCVLLVYDSLPMSRLLSNGSYDLPFNICGFAQPDLNGSEVIIIYIDEESLKQLGQPLDAPMDRALHARLLRKLKADGAKAVAMDIIFGDSHPEGIGDAEFAEAIRENGKVVLGVDYKREDNDNDVRIANPEKGPKAFAPVINHLTFPDEPFAQAAAKLGLAMLSPDKDFEIRQHFHALDPQRFVETPPSLSWAAAQLAGSKFTRDPRQQCAERWINYYGPPETVPHVSYQKALSTEGVRPGFFRNKVVFIGARPITTSFIERRDEFLSPYRYFRSREYFSMPAVEVHATEFLNLVRGDWLTRPGPFVEITVLALAAFVFGFGLLRFRPLTATGVAFVGCLVIVLISQSLFVMRQIWFPWLIIVTVQIPCALLVSFIFKSLEWIIQRRKLEEERRRAYARIQDQAALLDKAQDAIIVHDLEWKAQYWNKSAEKLYGWTFEEVKEKNLRSEIFKTDESKLIEAFQSVLAKGEWSGEFKQVVRSGKELTIQSRWTLVRDDEGKPRSIFVINTDVTEQKSLEAQFLRTQRMESIGTLAGGIAHDLNNVLSPIVMGVELLKMKVKDEQSQKMLNTMAGSARRGSDMVKQVLTFARGQTGERALVQIKHLIREMQKIAKETFPKNIDVQIEVETVRPILADATQMHQILLNLCVNARDAMPNGGGIAILAKDVTLTQAEADKFIGAKPINYVLLKVTDTGTGIPTEIIDKIFEPFFTTKEIGKGTGLGLSTVITIIKSHGGFLDLQTQVGKGTTFNVYLPAAESSAAPVTTDRPASELRGKGETVMVVDDEPAVVEMTKGILQHYGYKVVTANHGADALALHSQCKESVKVVLMDMMMPVMDGPTAIRELKSKMPELQVIAISGLMQSETLKERLNIEVPFLQKPFAAEKLLECLKRAVGEKKEQEKTERTGKGSQLSVVGC
jgi:two-component system cell cycle sensor histidine kinase/response regulator CckA